MHDRSAMHCIPQWTTFNDINSGMHTKRLDALFFPSDIQIACAKCFASSFMIQADAAFFKRNTFGFSYWYNKY